MSAGGKSNLAVRLLTAFIASPLILLLLYRGPAWGWLAFVSVAAVIGALEFFAMTHVGDRLSQGVGALLTLGVVAVLWSFGASATVLLSLLLLLPILSMLLVLWRLGDIRSAALRVTAGAFGPLWLGGGLGAIILLRRDAGAPYTHEGASYVVLAMLLSWLSDTGAYFAGRRFGRHKLYEAVSPKKTVEGAIGGLAGSLAGALFAHFVLLPSLPILHAVLLALIAGALGQMGDLGESLVKRSVGVKDSGGIVPGHGGILDRADALLVTSAITYLYVIWTRG